MWEQGERERRVRERRVRRFASLYVGQGLLLEEAPLLMIQLAWKPDLGSLDSGHHLCPGLQCVVMLVHRTCT